MKQTKGSLEILQKLLEFDMFHPLRLEQLADMEKMVSRIELNAGEILMEEFIKPNKISIEDEKRIKEELKNINIDMKEICIRIF